jgi:hypothetical protein
MPAHQNLILPHQIPSREMEIRYVSSPELNITTDMSPHLISVINHSIDYSNDN